ncbi:MAG TPA: bifunctional lysylphosphatidylglycerol flippase/synthetase MprF [Vicinamibacterales bacterium]|nr:bifunctional lysylphosphatidylglycerol flippase/synthetase MprF [Vicinamibacterales bacterium]
MSLRDGLRRRTEQGSTWLVARAGRAWGLLVIAVVLALTWEALRGIHVHEVRVLLRSLDGRWLVAAGGITLANVAIMGLYDVIAFSRTRTTAAERWRFGAVAFCWSNFLTLGPLAGPAIRLWLYRGTVERASELRSAIVSVVIAFSAGLIGWTLAAVATAQIGGGLVVLSLAALVCVSGAAWIARAIARRFEDLSDAAARPVRTLELALVGWLDWLLAMAAFAACLRAAGVDIAALRVAHDFFVGQAIGLASLIPGGFGSSDALWIARLPIDRNVTVAALAAYRFIYYIGPWFTASLVLLSWATRQSSRRTELARRVVAALVGAAGVLIIVSSASPAIHARLILMERYVPLPLVEAGQIASALAGLLLLALARGLARGYRAAYAGTLALLLLAGFATLLKGLDWEESVSLGVVAIAAWSHAGLFDRESGGDWLETADLGLGFLALLIFVVLGTFSHHLAASGGLDRVTALGYRFQAARFMRSALSMLFALSAATLYVLLRTPVHFAPPPQADSERAIEFNAGFGTGTTPMMVAVGDKSIFAEGERGFCLYRTIGAYLVVFSDPVVRPGADRAAFVDALFAFAAGVDRRPLFYQLSADWMPLLHDRGYHFFKLGEEALVPLERVTLQGHAGKLTRQFLRRAERDGLTFEVLAPYEIDAHLDELEAISDHWLAAKQVTERQFSIGYFSRDYIRRFPCAVVRHKCREGAILAFANLLEGPRRQELSVDLMRYRTDGPSVMDFLLTSVMLYGKEKGFRTFNLGMAPLASVGDQPGAHRRERVASLIFRRGEQWYNFQGVRSYKEKFNPEWVPRYLAYEAAWEWPVALANASALIAGGWRNTVIPGRDRAHA